VLHVEDNEASQFIRRATLEAAGFRVLGAATLAEAWDVLVSARPEVVLTDVHLPDGSGYELTRRIKQHFAVATTRVVQVSALFTDAESRVAGLDSGADAYIIEPADPRELVAIVRSMVRGRRSEQLFGTVLDASPALIAGADAAGRIVVFNAACEALTGWSRPDVMGRPFLETLVSAPDREAVRQRFQDASPAELAQAHENHWRTATGEQVLIEWRCFPTPAPNGGMWTLGIGEDVTGRREAEQAIEASERRFRSLSRCSPVGLFETDALGLCVYLNPRSAAIVGATAEQAMGSGWMNFLHPDDRPRAAAAWDAAVVGKREYCEELRWLRPDGSVRWTISRAAPIVADDAEVTGFVGTLEDITELKEATARIQQGMRLKDEFVATVAHELRQPLYAAATALNMLTAGSSVGSTEQTRALLERQIEQMSHVVDDLLDASTIIRGGVQLRPAAVDLRDVVMRAFETVAPAIRERNQQIVVNGPETLVRIEADPIRLQQILVNLLSNATKFTPRDGQIRVGIDQSDGAGVVVRVRDTGPGLAPEALSQIFEVFTRLRPEVSGLGIGLAVARRLAELHGGTLEAFSAGPGTGTEFVLRLPEGPPGPASGRG
jgi:PAS domain S-box-containing protein